MSLEFYHCGQPLHYTNPVIEQIMRESIAKYGPNIHVTCDGRTWLVPRHYLALHGVRGADLPAREHQRFVDFGVGLLRAVGPPVALNGQCVIDHLGILLAEKLLDYKHPSGARKTMTYHA